MSQVIANVITQVRSCDGYEKQTLGVYQRNGCSLVNKRVSPQRFPSVCLFLNQERWERWVAVRCPRLDLASTGGPGGNGV
jgi:hypothetical protein